MDGNDSIYVPETLEQCRERYIPPVKKYITCPDFGNIDGMDGSCIWCSEMFLYQWEMCMDESRLRGLTRLKDKNGNPRYSIEKAIEMINNSKKGYNI